MMGQLCVADVGRCGDLGCASDPVAPATSVAAATPVQTPNVGAPQPLDLFSDRNGTFSG